MVKHVVVVVSVVVLSSLPELLEKKRLIDMHTNVATAILEQIKVCAMHKILSFSVIASGQLMLSMHQCNW